MNVACLVPYPVDRVPGQRFRLEQWAAPLAARGIHLEFIPLLSSETMSILYKPGHLFEKSRDILAGCLARARFALEKAHDYDVVVIFREALLLGIDWIERILTRRVPTVFDFDDAVWLPNVSNANRRFEFLKGFQKVDRILGMVSSVSAGCGFLADHARQFNEHVHIVPTSIDLGSYATVRKHQATDVLTVGWTGSVTSSEYMKLIIPALQSAARELPMRVRLLGGKVDIPGVETECIEWTPDREIPVIETFDVGVKPAAREDWVRGKCPMKDIQYMALGIPPVATAFGTAFESIEHGVSGFLCDTDENWVTALKRLRDPAERNKLGAAARKVVEQRYSSEVAATAFAGALGDARDRFRRSQRAGRSS